MIQRESEEDIVTSANIVESAFAKDFGLHGVAIERAAVLHFERPALSRRDSRVGRIPIDT
jgi:hypothetical protein